MTICKIASCCLMVGLLWLATISAQEPAVEKKSADQTIDLFDDLRPAVVPATKEGEETTGEDIEFGSKQDPFAEIARKMKKSQAALEKQQLGEESRQLQTEIVTDFDRLLEQMQKQCSNCQGGKCEKPGASKPGSSAAKPGGTSKKPATDSTERLDKSGNVKSETQSIEELTREVWGHLPPKLREAMQNVGREEFLPKYSQLIEDYYRRLAEDAARNAP